MRHRVSRTQNRSRPSPSVECLEARTLLSVSRLDLGAFDRLQVETEQYSPSRILVRYRPEAEVALQSSGTLPGTALDLVPGLREVTLGDGVNVASALATYQTDPNVLYAQPDYVVRLDTIVVPNDPNYLDGTLWGLNNTGQSGGTIDADIDAPEAWDMNTGTGNMVVAVIDTGVDYTHPDLAANIWTNSGEIAGNGHDDDGNGYVDDIHGYDFYNNDGDPMDDHGHGTHVAGTIGAVGDNGLGVVGVAWHVQIMALKFLNASGNGYLSDAIAALGYAVRMGAKVSNNSYSGEDQAPAIANAIASARDGGHIFVAAAGNTGTNTDVRPAYPSSYTFDNLVAVAATDRNDQVASFSNYGLKSVDLAAPGVDILSTSKGGQYAVQSGTSMAAPYVTGAIALVWDRHPDWTYDQVIARVLSTVDPVSSLAGRSVTGGRLNVGRAIDTFPPTADILDVTPNPRTDSVDSISIVFSEPVNGITVDDLNLSRDGTPLDLSGANLSTTDGVTWLLSNLGPLTAPAGSYTLTLVALHSEISDQAGNLLAESTTESWSVTSSQTLRIAALTPSSSGFLVAFTKPIDPSTLNLYSAGTFGPADLVVTRNGIPVRGTLIVAPDNRSLTFLASGGPLATGSYSVTLRGAADGFRDNDADPLDGDGDGTPGGDYTTTFVSASSSSRVLSLPDFARGAGQDVNIPHPTTGIPLRLNDGDGLTSLTATLDYDPALLTINGITTDLPGASATVDTSTPGLARITVTTPTALAAGPIELARLLATVPTSAPYGAKQVLDLGDVVVNGGTIAAVADDAVQVAAFAGDVDGSTTINSVDSLFILQYVTNVRDGFTAYPTADPAILGDVDGGGSINSVDSLFILQYVTNVDPGLSRVPPRPSGLAPLSGGPDPKLSLPRDLSAAPGDTLSVPLTLEQTDPTTIALTSFDLVIAFDPSVFTVSGARLGGLSAGFTLLPVVIDATAGVVRIHGLRSTPLSLAPGTVGTLAELELVVRPDAMPGMTSLNLLAATPTPRGPVFTGLNGGGLTLVPAPTNAADDPVDGVVTITTATVNDAHRAFDCRSFTSLGSGRPNRHLGPMGRFDRPMAVVGTDSGGGTRQAVRMLRSGAAPNRSR